MKIRLRSNWSSFLLIGVLVLSSIGFADLAGALDDEPQWGETHKGLQVRILSVSKDTDERSPDISKATRTTEFKIADDVTLLVQVKNVSDKKISLQGVRYGKSVSDPWPGKSAQSKFGPFVFSGATV